MIHHVDISWNGARTGTDQVRFYKIEGDTLTIRTAPNKSPIDGREGVGIIVWGKGQVAATTSRADIALKEVTATGGLRAKLSRPLDFLVISDHAEMYGLMPQLLSGVRKFSPLRQARNGLSS